MGPHISKLQIPHDEAERPAKLLELVSECVPFFKDTPHTHLEEVSITVLAGGITNQLYRVKSLKGGGESVVVRVYGHETDRIISREAELFWQGKFLRTFGKSENALVYEFLQGYKPLDFMELPAWSVPIATVLASFHHRAAEARLCVPPYSCEANFCNIVMTEWVSIAINAREKIKADRPQQLELYDSLKVDTVYKAEGQWMLDFIGDKLRHVSPTGPCHNDLLCANLMVKEGTTPDTEDPHGDVRLIDFEYTKNNYLLFDVANHMNEYAGFDCLYEHFPSDAHIAHFVAAYMKALSERCGTENIVLQPGETQGTARPSGVVPVPIETLVKHIKFFSLASNFCWSVWGLIQGAFSAIEFDYLLYAKQRFDRYLSTKEEFSKL